MKLTAKEALEAVRILAGQCGRPKIRAENRKIIEGFIRQTAGKGGSK